MKLKYYLRGLGVGIIVTTILLMISFAKHGTMSDKEVIKRAEELGMVMQDTESVNEPSSEQIATENTEAQRTDEPEQNKDNTQTTEQQQLAEPQTTAEPQQPVEPQQSQIVEITVEKGEYCRAIGEKLAAAGLVDDAEAFRKYMGQIKYDEMVTSGVYQIPMGATYEEIANILVSGNN